MAENEVNIPLLRKAVEWVEAEAARPEADRAWNQGHWAQIDRRVDWTCGTTTCIAGHVVILEGWKPELERGARSLGPLTLVDYVTKDGEVRLIEELACELLGIPTHTWNTTNEPHLFDGDNTAQKIREIAEELAGERL